MKKFCIGLLDQAGSFEYTKRVMRELDDEICAEIERLGGNSVISKVMTELRDWDR